MNPNLYHCLNCERDYLYPSDHDITCPCHPANWLDERKN